MQCFEERFSVFLSGRLKDFFFYAVDIQVRRQGDSYHSLSETGQGILQGFWLCPLSNTV